MEEQREMFPGYTVGAIDRPTVDFGKSLTRQSDAEGADINVIMKRAEKTGVVPMYTREALFTDVSQIGSYREALEKMRLAQESFMTLPPGVREKFGNDAVAFLDFTSDPKNRDEMVSMGLLEATDVAKELEAKPSEPAKPAAQ